MRRASFQVEMSSLKDRTTITREVKDAVLAEVVDAVGKTVGAMGEFAGLVNPNLVTEYQTAQVSLKQAHALAAAIGMALDQG